MVIQLAKMKPRKYLLSLLIEIPKLLQSKILTHIFPPIVKFLYLHFSHVKTLSSKLGIV